MNQISPEQLLSQIRSMSKTLQAPSAPPMPAVEKTDGTNFSKMVKSALDSVNDAQQTSSDLKLAVEKGTPGVSVAEAMIAAQNANLSFRAVTEVRNKLVTAYQDIMNMPV